MEMHYSEQDNGISLIKLVGRLDLIGTGEIETKFAGYCSGDKVRVAVDLSDVDFLASIGIRLFVLTAKSIARLRSGIAISGFLCLPINAMVSNGELIT